MKVITTPAAATAAAAAVTLWWQIYVELTDYRRTPRRIRNVEFVVNLSLGRRRGRPGI